MFNISKLFGRGEDEPARDLEDEPPAPAPAPAATPTDETGPAPGPDSAAASAPADPYHADTEALREAIIQVIRTVYDPEIPVNIYDLGLIYNIDVDPTGFCHIRMTLTAPNCPAAGYLPGEVEQKAALVEGIRGVTVDVVWEPQWNQSMMSDAARLELGIY
ncbi:MAG: hypothetical protein BWZ08_01245 [candidate division BRC1 bacterium ADurb.BinA292]|nr:MAG: hypothetical protein BWZ08_01245 [candidate division BRC1 bacterium ADurb.BinA292]HOR26944.1 DUF59 domain-containing protein [Candidatus Sumerlaeota bacterium]